LLAVPLVVTGGTAVVEAADVVDALLLWRLIALCPGFVVLLRLLTVAVGLTTVACLVGSPSEALSALLK